MSAPTVPHLWLPLIAVVLSCTLLLLTKPAASQIASVPPPSGDHFLLFESAICGTVGWSNTSLPNFLLLTDVVAIA